MKRLIEFVQRVLPTRPTRVPLDSSAIEWVSYDRHRRSLIVGFRAKRSGASGGRYEYGSVEPHRFRDLLRAESAGRYFVAEIRNAYPTRRIV